MSDCPHDQFESQVRVRRVATTTGIGPYHQVWLQVRCAACQAPVTFGALMPVNPNIFLTLASGASPGEVVLSGVVAALPAAEEPAWTPVAMPAREEDDAQEEPEGAEAEQHGA